MNQQHMLIGDLVVKGSDIYEFVAAHSAGAWNDAHVKKSSAQTLYKNLVEDASKNTNEL